MAHYNDVIMGAIASQITSLTFVCPIVYSDADQRKHQSSASLAFVRGIPRTNGQLRGKCFHLMTSSCQTHDMTGNTPETPLLSETSKGSSQNRMICLNIRSNKDLEAQDLCLELSIRSDSSRVSWQNGGRTASQDSNLCCNVLTRIRTSSRLL